MKRHYFIGAILLTLLGIAIYVNSTTTDRKEAAPVEGFLAPHFSLATLEGKKIHLPDQNGQPIVLNFWTSWCRPCQAEAPALEKLHQQYQGKVLIVGVNLTAQDTVDNVKKFQQQHRLHYPLLLDPNNEVGHLYEANAIPSTYLIDKNGVIVEKIKGAIDPVSLENKIQPLLIKE